MPIEQRSLIFSTAEFISAIMLYHKKRGGKLYTILDVRNVQTTARNAGGSTVFTMSDGKTLSFCEADLLAALISYCFDKNIPLPVRASKNLHAGENGVTLTIADWECRTRTPLKFGALAG